MNSIKYNIYSNFKEIDSLIENLPKILPQSNTQDISLVLFEVLANILEHSICHYTKNEIYGKILKTNNQLIDLTFNTQNNQLEIIICYNAIPSPLPSKKSTQSSNHNGKKIIKYLCKKHSYKTIGIKTIEKISFDMDK